MAIGDTFSARFETAASNRQPASGVSEMLTGGGIGGTTDPFIMYDGTNWSDLMAAAVLGSTETTTTRNMKVIHDNGLYLRKNGTSNSAYMTGVQVNV